MQTQDVDRHSSGGCKNEALTSHERAFANSAYSFSQNSAMLGSGCTRVTLTSPFGRSEGNVPVTPVYVDKRDRRNTCRTASRAFSQLALWPLSQLAHSPHRKNSSLSSPSRFRLSRPSPVNTSNLFKVELGQAVSPVPLLSECANLSNFLEQGQRPRPSVLVVRSSGACDQRYRVTAKRGNRRVSRHYKYSGPCARPPFFTRTGSVLPTPVSLGLGGVS